MLKTAKVVGLNSDTDAALVLIGEVDSSRDSNLRLFAIISCSADDAFSTVRQILPEAENIFCSSEGVVGDRLSQTLEAVINLLKDTEKPEILLAATQESTDETALYILGKKGLLEAYLIRNENQTNLCESTDDYQLVSGILKDGDRVVLTTHTLVNLLNSDFSTFIKTPINLIEEEITGRLPEAENYPVAAIILESENPVEEGEIFETKEIEEVEVTEKLMSPRVQIPVKEIFVTIKKIIPRSKRGIAIIGLGLLILAVIGVIIGFQQKKESEISSQFNQYFQEALAEYNKAQSLRDLDVGASSQSLKRAKEVLEKALKIKPKEQSVLDLKKQIEDNTGMILKNFIVNDLPLWLDLDLIKKDFKAQNLSLSHGKLLVLDTNKKTLVQIDLNSKSPQILAGEEKLGEANLASLNGSVAWVYSKNKGLIRIDVSNSSLSVAVKPDKEWGEISGIYGFAGNVYLLDKTSGQIWKYVPVVSGYSDKQAYLKSKIDLGSIIKLQIDSSVWLLKSGGEILKFTQGVPDYFTINGLDKQIRNPKSLFVSDEIENIYLLDGDNRLLVFDKKGGYKGQYTSDKFGIFDDLVVDEQGKKVYFLGGDKIYLMELK